MATRAGAEGAGPSRRRLYDVLGVAPAADGGEIRRAYRRLARSAHPDANPGDAAAAERFRRIVEAYEVLSDGPRRALYDEFGEESLERGFDPLQARARRAARERARERAGPERPSPRPAPRRAPRRGLGALLSSLWEGGGDRGPERGADVEVAVRVDLLEAVRGTERTIALARPSPCSACEAGRGGRSQAECEACRGEGVVYRRVRARVRIPPGVHPRGLVRVAGQGGAGRRGGPSGDLLLRIEIEPHPLFQREGKDLSLDVPITVAEAIRGARLEIPTPSGPVRLRVPPGTQSGRRLRLPGRGVPDPRGGAAGDLYARVLVHVPEPSDRAAEIADSLDPLYRAPIRRGLRV